MIRTGFASVLLALVLNSCMTGRAVSLSGSQPRDLTDCFVLLDSLLDPGKIAQIKSMTEEEFERKGQLGLGKWIRNSWWLWKDGDLSRTFQALGVTHPDDMRDIILRSHYRYLYHRPLEIQQQIDRTKSRRQELNLQALFESGSIGVVQ